jgi:hypothetical protein
VWHIFIGMMIGSWEEEYKDLSAVGFRGIGDGEKFSGAAGEVKTRTLHTPKGSAPPRVSVVL